MSSEEPRATGRDTHVLVFYVGLFGGIILTDLALLGTIETGLFRVVIGAVVGLALGWLLGFVYSASKPREPR
ncbi:MAG: hypothetical protein H6737_13260 [Alphaproteobacteria bacterium]|nr:hypothetical protein [Alphaproteobacteria bacterium]